MKSPTHVTCVCLIAGVMSLAPCALAQSFNIDFSDGAAGPETSYGAATGQTGFWNSMHPVHAGGNFPLMDLNGDPSAVIVSNIGGTGLPTTNDPATTGADEALLDDYLVTFSAGLETCLFFKNMQPGTYVVTQYCWIPAAPSIMSYATVDQSAEGAQIIGGAWTGQHEKFVTYSEHIAVVGENGVLNTHSGIVPGADAMDGAALNGVQLRFVAGDFDGDAIVDGADLATLLSQWGNSGLADLNGDGVVNGADLAALLANWT